MKTIQISQKVSKTNFENYYPISSWAVKYQLTFSPSYIGQEYIIKDTLNPQKNIDKGVVLSNATAVVYLTKLNYQYYKLYINNVEITTLETFNKKELLYKYICTNNIDKAKNTTIQYTPHFAGHKYEIVSEDILINSGYFSNNPNISQIIIPLIETQKYIIRAYIGFNVYEQTIDAYMTTRNIKFDDTKMMSIRNIDYGTSLPNANLYQDGDIFFVLRTL